MLDSKEAISRIETVFPELTEALHNEIIEGLFYVQVAEFARLTQKAIDDGDRVKFRRICNLFKFLFLNGSPEVINALNVAFLEHLNVTDGKKRRTWAYAAMPELMKKAYNDMAEYNRRMREKAY